MSTFPDLANLPAKAADWITSHGWVQGTEQDAVGAVCLTGALRYCDPKPGDWLIARAVLRHRGHAETWNDADDRTEGEVTEYLRSATISDADLADTFGPQWEAIGGLIRAAAALTPGQANELSAIWSAIWSGTGTAAWAAAWDAAGTAASLAAWAAAWDAAGTAAGTAAWDAARGAAWDAARDAARGAAWALVVRDRIGQSGFTQTHYDTLTAPWVTVMGAVHPGDVQATA